MPPYLPLLEWLDGAVVQIRLSLTSFGYFLEDPLYAAAYLNSLKMAAVATAICLLIGYPMAYAITRVRQPWRNALLMMVILPFWDVVPDPDLRLDRHPQERRAAERAADVARPHRPAACRFCIRISRSMSASSIPTCRS